MSGVLPVIGPLAPAPYVPQRGLTRCGCDPTTGASCRVCDGSAFDGSEVAQAMATYYEQHPDQRRSAA